MKIISEFFTAPFLSNRSPKLRIETEAITKVKKRGKMKNLTVRPFILPLFCSLVIAYISIRNFDDRLLKNGAVKNSEIIPSTSLLLNECFHQFSKKSCAYSIYAWTTVSFQLLFDRFWLSNNKINVFYCNNNFLTMTLDEILSTLIINLRIEIYNLILYKR